MSARQNCTELSGLRILVVEDDLLIAMELEDVLGSAGCVVVGPCGRLDQALETAASTALDGALVDMNLRGSLSLPLIELLKERSVPMVICSGYADLPNLKEHFADIPLLAKPCSPESLLQALKQAIATRRPLDPERAAVGQPTAN